MGLNSTPPGLGRGNLLWEPSQGCDGLWPAWRGHFGLKGPWPGETLIGALLESFCAGLWAEEPEDLASLDGPALFLANHQVAVESILFATAVTPFLRAPLHAIAKSEHASSWVGQLFGLLHGWPGTTPLDTIFFQDLGDARALLELTARLKTELSSRGCGLLIHVAASRMLTCRDPLRTLSGVLLDLAIALEMPVFPVRFLGGLPVEPLEGFLDFPCGLGKQQYLIGRAIPAATLAAMPYGARRALVMERINALGVPAANEVPSLPNPYLKSRMRAPMTRLGVLEPALATIWAALSEARNPAPEIAAVLAGIDAGRVMVPCTAAGHWSAALGKWLTEGRLPVQFIPPPGTSHEGKFDL
jgi:hypothetical protein